MGLATRAIYEMDAGGGTNLPERQKMVEKYLTLQWLVEWWVDTREGGAKGKIIIKTCLSN